MRRMLESFIVIGGAGRTAAGALKPYKPPVRSSTTGPRGGPMPPGAPAAPDERPRARRGLVGSGRKTSDDHHLVAGIQRQVDALGEPRGDEQPAERARERAIRAHL